MNRGMKRRDFMKSGAVFGTAVLAGGLIDARRLNA